MGSGSGGTLWTRIPGVRLLGRPPAYESLQMYTECTTIPYYREMTMMNELPADWTQEDLLSSYQIAGLLAYNAEALPRAVFAQIENAATPVQPNLWTPDQVREVMDAVQPGTHTEYSWAEDELLTYKQCAALHSPPIKPDTFAGYVRRAAKREAEGLDTTYLPPKPELIRLGHPLFAPDLIGSYLRNRPGPGYFVSGDARRGYRGGRPAGTIPKRVRRVIKEPVGAE